MVHLIIRSFIFRVQGYLNPLVETGQILYARFIEPSKNIGSCVNTACNGFSLSGNVASLHLDDSIARDYLCNEGDIISLSFRISLSHIESG